MTRRRPLAAPSAPPPPSAPDHIRARWWRLHAARLTQAELADLLHMSVGTIADYEAGKIRRTGKPIAAATMRRYRLMCAAIAAGWGSWDWPR